MSIQKRLYDCASIGGPYVDAGLSHDQASAHYGLINGTLEDMANLAKAIPDSGDLPLVSLVAMIVERHKTELAIRAAVLQWTKRKTAYDAEHASWKTAEPNISADWRTLPMTEGQRHLMADTARILVIDVPEGMDRGAASDWLEANSAHVIYRLGGDNT